MSETNGKLIFSELNVGAVVLLRLSLALYFTSQVFDFSQRSAEYNLLWLIYFFFIGGPYLISLLCHFSAPTVGVRVTRYVAKFQLLIGLALLAFPFLGLIYPPLVMWIIFALLLGGTGGNGSGNQRYGLPIKQFQAFGNI